MVPDPNQRLRITVLGCWANTLAGPTTSFLIRVGESSILLDAGCDPIGRLAAFNVAPAAVDTLYLSHLHSDHAGGVANFAFTRALFARREPEPSSRLKIVAQETILEGAQQLVRIQYPERDLPIDWIGLNEDETYSVNNSWKLAIFANDHTVTCFGALLASEHNSVAFTSDGAPSLSQTNAVKNSRILIGEAFGLAAQAGQDIHQRGHSTAEDLSALAAVARCEVIIPFHFDDKYSKHDDRALLMAACSLGNSAVVIDPVANPSIEL